MEGWNLKPRTPNSRTSRRASRAPTLPLAGSMLANGIRTSPFGGRLLGHLLVGVAPKAGLALGIDGEDDGADLAGAVVGGRLVHGRRVLVGRAEVLRHGGLEIVVAVVGVRAARLLGVGVHVDGDELVDVHARSSLHP